MGSQNFIGTDLRVANEVTFIPGTEPRNHRALVTAMSNTKGRNGETYSDEVSLIFWGKRAIVAATYLYKGKQINVYGRYQSHTTDTGQITPGGKKILNRNVQVVVSHMELLGDSMKKIEEIVAINLGRLKAAGRIPQELTVTAKELLDNPKPALTDFNPAVSAQTGKFGLANVWSKDRGFWKPGMATPTGTPVPSAEDKVKALEEELAKLKGNSPAPQAADAGAAVDPFVTR